VQDRGQIAQDDACAETRHAMMPIQRLHVPRPRWIGACALALACVAVHAHAIVVSSRPSVGTTMKQDDVAVELRFNSRIDHRRSRLSLIGPDSNRSDLFILNGTQPDVVAADAGRLVSGNYRLRWQVMSIDGHITRGDIPFCVAR
jgi:methionine-rich copper-binding protein CopC